MRNDRQKPPAVSLLSMVIFITLGLIGADEPSKVIIYSSHRDSEIYLNDSFVGTRNEKMNLSAGTYQVTVKYKGNSVKKTIQVRNGQTLRHTQIASPVTFGVGFEGSLIYHPLSVNFGLTLNPTFTIRDRNLLGFSIGYHTKTLILMLPSVLNFQYYYLFNQIFSNQRIGLGAKLGIMFQGWMYPNIEIGLLGTPHDMNLFYLAPSLMYQFGNRPIQVRITTDVLLGTRRYIFLDPNSNPDFTAAFRCAIGLYLDF